MIDLSESMAGCAYSDAYNKYMVGLYKNDQLLVPFAAWIDETGLTKNMPHPCQPFLINSLLPKRDCQRNRLLAYVDGYQTITLWIYHVHSTRKKRTDHCLNLTLQ